MPSTVTHHLLELDPEKPHMEGVAHHLWTLSVL